MNSFSSEVVYSMESSSKEQIRTLIREKRSFVLTDVSRMAMPEAVTWLEKLVDDAGMRSRVYAKGRTAVIGAAVIPTPFTWGAALASAAFIGAHNLVTINPDYEIGTNRVTGTITLEHTKWTGETVKKWNPFS